MDNRVIKETKAKRRKAPKKENGNHSSQNKVLGRGLAAILAEDIGDLAEGFNGNFAADANSENIKNLAIDKIYPNPAQPRMSFKEETIDELTESIKKQGLMQPIIVRVKQGTPDEYELVAGERRWRASMKAGLPEIPALIREISDEQSAVLALIENIQREDLNPLDQARAMEELRTQHKYTQQELADSLGKSRATVTNLLRIINLEKPVRDFLAAGKLSLGHAKVLLALEGKEQIKLANEAVNNELSVRDLEQLIQRMNKKTSSKGQKLVDANIISLQQDLSDKLGVRVVFNHKKNGTGKMMIHYHSADELDGVLKNLKLKKATN